MFFHVQKTDLILKEECQTPRSWEFLEAQLPNLWKSRRRVLIIIPDQAKTSTIRSASKILDSVSGTKKDCAEDSHRPRIYYDNGTNAYFIA